MFCNIPNKEQAVFKQSQILFPNFDLPRNNNIPRTNLKVSVQFCEMFFSNTFFGGSTHTQEKECFTFSKTQDFSRQPLVWILQHVTWNLSLLLTRSSDLTGSNSTRRNRRSHIQWVLHFTPQFYWSIEKGSIEFSLWFWHEKFWWALTLNTTRIGEFFYAPIDFYKLPLNKTIPKVQFTVIDWPRFTNIKN